MARYIDADALIEKIKEKATEMFTVNSFYEYYIDALIDVEDIIKAESTADVVEWKKGEWIQDRLVSTNGGTYGVRRCSNCENYYQDVGYGWNYCPNCGSDMRKEVK